MSSKYHWTQELTNPQDRFRLYQQWLNQVILRIKCYMLTHYVRLITWKVCIE